MAQLRGSLALGDNGGLPIVQMSSGGMAEMRRWTLSCEGETGLWWLFWGLCALQFFAWTLALTLSHRAPPLDVVEMYVWAQAGVVATFKHPNGPGLLLEAARQLVGPATWLPYALSQLAVVVTFLCVFLLGRELLGTARGLAGSLLLTGLLYSSWVTPEFNHNVLQLPLWALLTLSVWRATASEGLLWWLVLGLVAGLSLWVKYFASLLLLVSFLWLLYAERHCFRSMGPWLALLCAVMVAAPQAHFLWVSDFAPLEYIRQSSEIADPWLYFLAAQLAFHLPLLVMAVAAGLFRGDPPQHPAPHKARLFLAWMGLMPALLLLLLGVFGVGLKDMWGMPMFSLSGLLLLAYSPGVCDARALRRLATFACVLLIVLPVAYAGQLALAPTWRDKASRTSYPQALIASRFRALYERRTGMPLRLVAGPVWAAGLVALSEPRLAVIIDGSRRKSPWVSERQLAEAALAIWPVGWDPGQSLRRLMAARGLTEADWDIESFHWSTRQSARPMAFVYAIIPPRETQSGR